VNLSRVFSFLLLLSAFAFAEHFAVNFGGRIRPLFSLENFLAYDFCGKSSCGGVAADSLLIAVRSGVADSSEIFRVDRSDAVDILHLEKGKRFFSYEEFKASRGLLAQYAERSDPHPLTREFVRLNSALDLYDSLKSPAFWSRISIPYSLLSPKTLFRVQAEDWYLTLNLPFAIWLLACATFVCALLSFAFRRKFLYALATWGALIVAVFSLLLLVWRGFVESQIPLVSLYELLFVLVLGLSIAAFVFGKKKFSRGLFTAIAGGVLAILLFVRASLSSGDTFSPVSILLDSPFWLSLHVFSIAAGFCVLLLSSVLAHVLLVMRARGRILLESSRHLLYICLRLGLLLSCLGVLLGGFWANVAWGRFWGFDPKENGALMVILWVVLVLHLKAGNLVSEKSLEILSALLSVVIAFCLLGVNLLGVGLHSYGFSAGLFSGFAAFVLLDLTLVAVLHFLIFRRAKDF